MTDSADWLVGWESKRDRMGKKLENRKELRFGLCKEIDELVTNCRIGVLERERRERFCES